MLRFILLVAWLCEARGAAVGSLKTSEIQNDDGHINSLKHGPPQLTVPGETELEFEGDFALQEGDMLLPTDRNAVSQLWPEVNGRLSVPYEIDFGVENRAEDILKALNMISEKTCVHFHPHTDEADYLHFEYGSGCASYVGCVGGEQPVLIGPTCKAGNICHEVLHSLGFHHEHSRVDREEYITILYGNIASGKEDNFMKKKGKTFGLKYDLDSILHYGFTYFSRNGNRTILPKDRSVKIGQRTRMSDLDVQRVSRLYRCETRPDQNQMTSV